MCAERKYKPVNNPQPTIDRALAEALLVEAREAQTAYWDVLGRLEEALGGIAVDQNADLEDADIESLLDGDPV
jgi:hypothetical protein